MIEKIVADYLTDRSGLVAYLEEPERPPKTYLLVEKQGSGERERLDEAMITVQTYAPSLYETATLNLSVKKIMLNMAAELDEVTRCECSSDYNFTDPQTHRYRYQAVYIIRYYEE